MWIVNSIWKRHKVAGLLEWIFCSLCQACEQHARNIDISSTLLQE